MASSEERREEPAKEMGHKTKVIQFLGRTTPIVLQNNNGPCPLLARPVEVPTTSTIDPFRNHTQRIEGVYEWLKILICVPIAIVRLVLFGSSLLVGFVATKFALQGSKDFVANV